jgi:sorbitol-specific phosphotransferase system component IIBC
MNNVEEIIPFVIFVSLIVEVILRTIDYIIENKEGVIFR